MNLSYKLKSLFDEISWNADSSFRSSVYKIQTFSTSYGSFSGSDYKDYYAITPGIGSFTLVVTADGSNGFNLSKYYYDFDFDVKVTDNVGNIILNADSLGPDIYSDSITFTSKTYDTYYVEITNTFFSKFSYASTLNQTVALPIDLTPPTVSTFSPADGATGVATTANIVVTFSEAIQKGTGFIGLWDGSKGVYVETYDAAISSRLTVSGSTLTIDPTSTLSAGTPYYVTFASGTLKDTAGNAYTGTLDYDFTTVATATTLNGTAGNDTLNGTAGDDTLDGGAGVDAVAYAGNRSAFTVSKGTDGTWHVQSLSSGNDTLSNIERITFADGTLALDTSSGNSGVMYRLYKAAFDRAPDAPGLGWNIHLVDAGMTQSQMADAFVHSAEFTNTYGALSNAQFINQLYLNGLDRTPDAPGLAWNLNLLNTTLTRADMLSGFSESAENQTNVIGQTQDGIWFTGNWLLA